MGPAAYCCPRSSLQLEEFTFNCRPAGFTVRFYLFVKSPCSTTALTLVFPPIKKIDKNINIYIYLLFFFLGNHLLLWRSMEYLPLNKYLLLRS